VPFFFWRLSSHLTNSITTPQRQATYKINPKIFDDNTTNRQIPPCLTYPPQNHGSKNQQTSSKPVPPQFVPLRPTPQTPPFHPQAPTNPCQTRITTKYSLNPPIKPSKLSSRRRKAASTPSASEPKSSGQTVLVLKTYDQISGATLKYKTDKAADVGRLIASLGRLGRNMAALPENMEGIVDDDGEDAAQAQVQAIPQVVESKGAAAGAVKSGGGAPPTGKKGKKKGKKWSVYEVSTLLILRGT